MYKKTNKPALYYDETNQRLETHPFDGAIQYIRADILWWHLSSGVLPRVDGTSSAWVETLCVGDRYPKIACYTIADTWMDTEFKEMKRSPDYWRPIVTPKGYISTMSKDRKQKNIFNV